MQRLVAGLALFVFMAACSDSSSTAPRQVQPSGTALHLSDPPPPPLSGAGDGFLLAGSDDFSALNGATTLAAPICTSGPGFNLTYNFKYLVNNTLNNEMAHIDIFGATTGQVTMHDKGLGKTDAKGRVQDGSFAFDITDGDGVLSASSFSYTVSGTLTNLVTGEKCQSFGSLNGTLVEVIGD